MIKELRCTWVNEQKLQNCEKFEILSICSESCLEPFFYIQDKWKHLISLTKQSNRIKIVTPRIGQNHIAKTNMILDKLNNIDFPFEFVVNDWGVFYLLCNNYRNSKIHLGRHLSRSLIDCPWKHEIVGKEELANEIIAHPYNDLEIIEFFISKGVIGIEINKYDTMINLRSLTERNMEVAVHEKYYMLSCGRTCLAKRIEPSKSCYEICKQTYRINLTDKWLGIVDNQVKASEYERSLLGDILVCGKQVLGTQIILYEELKNKGITTIITENN